MIRTRPACERCLCSLAVVYRRRRAGFAICLVPKLDVEGVVDAHQSAVPVPMIQVLPDCPARRQILWQRLPVTSVPQHGEPPRSGPPRRSRFEAFPHAWPAGSAGQPTPTWHPSHRFRSAPRADLLLLDAPASTGDALSSTQASPGSHHPLPQTQLLSG